MQPTTDEIFAALRTCRIPEIPVNLGERGLFHGVGITATDYAAPDNRHPHHSRPTDCPMPHGIAGAAQRTLGVLATVRSEIGCRLVAYSRFCSKAGLLRSMPAS